MRQPPSQSFNARDSRRNKAAKTMTKTTLSLSTGATRDTSPIWIARKQQSHDNPVATPDNTRNSQARRDNSNTADDPCVARTTPHTNTHTTDVRIAVARFEFTLATPTLTRMAVAPAKTAESKDQKSQFIRMIAELIRYTGLDVWIQRARNNPASLCRDTSGRLARPTCIFCRVGMHFPLRSGNYATWRIMQPITRQHTTSELARG